MSRACFKLPGAALVLAMFASPGCDREPLDVECPDVAAGDLVVSEMRGAQSGPDTWGQWIELYNASGRSLSLAGLSIEVLRIDGGAEAHVVVRRPDLSVGAGEYVVVGLAEQGAEPAHIDYGYALDFDADLYDAGGITVSSCGDMIDRVVYRNLPSSGTLSLDGAVDPDAAANDDADAGDSQSAWCADTDAGGSTTELGLPGTPGERNRTCN